MACLKFSMALASAGAIFALTGCDPVVVEFTEAELKRIEGMQRQGPPPVDSTNQYAEDDRAAHLGQYLFFDTRFSGDGTISCATCHDPQLGMGDGLALSEGMGDVPRHAPGLWDTVYQRWFFWDGRADSHWSQALGPWESPVEHGGDRMAFAHIVDQDGDLKDAYTAIFGPFPDISDGSRFPPRAMPDGQNPSGALNQAWLQMSAEDQNTVTEIFVNLGKAVGAYEGRLIVGDTPFDRFAQGLQDGDRDKLQALSPAAQRGLKHFAGDANCHFCHFGPALSNYEFHNIGLATPSWYQSGDAGRANGIEALLRSPFNAAGPYSDDPEGDAAKRLTHLTLTAEQLGQFKTPPLRNVALSAPYMHGGHLETLEDVIRHYSELPTTSDLGHMEESLIPLNLTDAEIADLVAFLESLTDDNPPTELLSQPAGPGL